MSMLNKNIGERFLSGLFGAGLNLINSTAPLNERLLNASSTFFNNLGGGYDAARIDRTNRTWRVSKGMADEELLKDLPSLRNYSRDSYKNNTVGRGAILTVNTNTIGRGLNMQCVVDASTLGMNEVQHEEFCNDIEKKWKTYANSTECDAENKSNLNDIGRLAQLTYLQAGEVYVTLPFIERKNSVYKLRVKLSDPESVYSPIGKTDANLRDGIQLDDNGQEIGYYFKKNEASSSWNNDWVFVKAIGNETGRKNVLHIYKQERPGQTHGIPLLAPVLKKLKQRDRYTDTELAGSIVSNMFTVFIKSNKAEASNSPLVSSQTKAGKLAEGIDYKLGNGAVVPLDPDETIELANPTRPNSQFEAFLQANLKEIGIALQIPYEILAKQFMASYSASRAARLEAWKYFIAEREFFVNKFYQPIYEEWFTVEVLNGRINAPGFFTDYLKKWAYLKTNWIGDGMGQIDEVKAVLAADMRVESNYSTGQEETSQMNGGDYAANIRKRLQETKKLKQITDIMPEGMRSRGYLKKVRSQIIKKSINL